MFSQSFRDLDPWECGASARSSGIAFGRSPEHGFQGFGSQASLSGQTTAQPRDWWARKCQSTEPDTGSCTTGAAQSGGQTWDEHQTCLCIPREKNIIDLLGRWGIGQVEEARVSQLLGWGPSVTRRWKTCKNILSLLTRHCPWVGDRMFPAPQQWGRMARSSPCLHRDPPGCGCTGHQCREHSFMCSGWLLRDLAEIHLEWL